MKTRWDTGDIPDQAGRTAVVTGANSGLGLATTTALTAAGARVIMAVRDVSRGEQVRPEGAEVCRVDLADLANVRSFAADLPVERIDVLVNNAGVMALPRRRTADGFEMQFGTNHLGHFALTGLLLPRLLAAPAPRVVTVSSTAHRMGWMDFADLDREHRYHRWLAYGQSKLANLLFCFELDRRARAAGAPLVSAAAHPGYAATNLQTAGPRMAGRAWQEPIIQQVNRIVGQSAEMGALPQLYAATAPDVRGGDYFGPGGIGEQRGFPRQVGTTRRARNEQDARRLWDISSRLTSITYEWSP